jgi:hypothetical protein
MEMSVVGRRAACCSLFLAVLTTMRLNHHSNLCWSRRLGQRCHARMNASWTASRASFGEALELREEPGLPGAKRCGGLTAATPGPSVLDSDRHRRQRP